MPRACFLISALVLSSLPAFAVTASYEARCGTRNTVWSNRAVDGRSEISLNTDRCQLSIELVGDVELNSDESGVAALDPGGRLDIRETFEGIERRLLVSAPPDAPTHRFWVDGQLAPIDDDEARAWLRLVLPPLYSVAGIDVGGRVAELLESAGEEGVLEEVGRLSGDRLQRRYLEELARQVELDDDGYAAFLRTAGHELSDRELAQLLIGCVDQASAVGELAYVGVVSQMRSGGEALRALTALVARPEVAPETLAVMIDTIRNGRRRRLRGDVMIAELVSAIADRDGELSLSFPVLAREIKSDHLQRHVLTVALQKSALRKSPDVARIGDLLAAATGIDSDHETAELLVQAGWLIPQGKAFPESFFAAAATIESDYEKRRALSAAVRLPGLPPATVAALLASAKDIDSDYEMAELLTRVVRTQQIGEDLAEPFQQALQTVDSKHQRQRVEEVARLRP